MKSQNREDAKSRGRRWNKRLQGRYGRCESNGKHRQLRWRKSRGKWRLSGGNGTGWQKDTHQLITDYLNARKGKLPRDRPPRPWLANPNNWEARKKGSPMDKEQTTGDWMSKVGLRMQSAGRKSSRLQWWQRTRTGTRKWRTNKWKKRISKLRAEEARLRRLRCEKREARREMGGTQANKATRKRIQFSNNMTSFDFIKSLYLKNCVNEPL